MVHRHHEFILHRYGDMAPHSKITGSRLWPFGVTWRHRSRDHSTPGGRIPDSLLNILRQKDQKYIVPFWTPAKHLTKFCTMAYFTSNLSKAHVTRDSSGPATLAISVELKQ